jgi:hypothetical protein
MADDLPNLWQNLSLTEDEDIELSFQKVDLIDGVTYGKSCVLGKLLADRLVSRETICTSMMQWWRLSESLTFKVLGDNLFLIEFDDPKDKEKVMEGRPWAFEGSLFLVEDFDGTKSPSQYTFDKAAFWVRMKNMPLACMGREIGRKIGASVGEVVAVDTDARGMGWGESLRVKILLDLAKPLQRGRKINIEGIAHWITFQYEHLPKFCFQCGVIWHGKTGCSRRSFFRQQEANQYGPWLRAPSPTRLADRNNSRVPVRRGINQSTNNQTEGKYHREGRKYSSAGEREGFAGVSSGAGESNKRSWKNKNYGGKQGENPGEYGERFENYREFNEEAGNPRFGKKQNDYARKKANLGARREKESFYETLSTSPNFQKANTSNKLNTRTQGVNFEDYGNFGDSCSNKNTAKEREEKMTGETIKRPINAGDSLLTHKSSVTAHYPQKSPAGLDRNSEIRGEEKAFMEKNKPTDLFEFKSTPSWKERTDKEGNSQNRSKKSMTAREGKWTQVSPSGKWELGKGVMEGSPLHELGPNENSDTRPKSGGVYKGPKLTDLTKTFQEAQSGDGEIVSEGGGKAMATWKRKEREWTTEQEENTGRKKKENGKEVDFTNTESKGCKTVIVGKLEDGSGLAEVELQPRRPQ